MIRTSLLLVIVFGVAGCARAPEAISRSSEPSLSASAEPSGEKDAKSGGEAIRRPDDGDAVEFTRHAWQYAGFDGQEILTPNYRIYTTATRDEFVEHLPIFFEAALDHYSSFLADLPRPNKRMETYLFQDRRQWQVKTQELLPRQADLFGTLGRGGFATQGIAVLYYIDWSSRRGSRDTFAITAHEGWHQYTQNTFEHSLPIWLEEGIATYMESIRVDQDGAVQFRPWTNRERWNALYKAAHNDSLIPLNELLDHPPQHFLESGRGTLLTYYAQVWALTRFLVEGADGEHGYALRQVLLDAADGRLIDRLMNDTGMSQSRRRMAARLTRTGPWLIDAYFADDRDAFERAYHEYVEQLTRRDR